MKSLLIIAFLSISLVCSIYGQNKQIDSLKNELSRFGNDTNKVNLYNSIAVALKNINLNDAALENARQSYELAKKLGFKKGMGNALRQQGNINSGIARYFEAIENLNKAVDIFLKIKDKDGASRCLNNIGNTFSTQKDFTKSIIYYSKAAKLAEEIGNKTGLAIFTGNIGTAYEKMFNYQQAYYYHLKALNLLQQIPDRIQDLANAYKSCGANYLSLNKYEESRDYFFNAIKIFEKLGNKYEIAGDNLDIGSTYMYQANYSKAIEYFIICLNKGKEINNNGLMAMAYNNIGQSYFYLSNYPKALENFLSALKIAESLGKSGLSGVAAHSGNIGVIYYSQKNYEKALEYATNALKINDELGNKTQKATNLTNIGNVYKSTGKYEKALEYYFKALSLNESLNKKVSAAIDLVNIGNVYYKQFSYDKALEYYFKAYKINDEITNTKGISETLFSIGEVYSHENQDFKSLQFMEKAAAIAQKTNNRTVLINIYESLSDYYSKKGNPQKALEYKKLNDSLNDSVFNLESSNKIAELILSYEKEKKEKEKEILQKDIAFKELEITKQTSFRNYFIITSVMILLLAIGTYNRYIHKKKTNKILEEKNNLLKLANEQLDISYKEKLQLQEEAHEKESQLMILKNEMLENELDLKNNELTTLALSIVDKHEYMAKLREQAEELGKAKPESIPDLVRSISRSIYIKLRSEESWSFFETQFKSIHRGFMEYLISQFPELTVMEMKVCSLLKINLASKEIASILNLSIRTVEMHRTNIRKKLNLETDTNLNHFLTLLNYKR